MAYPSTPTSLYINGYPEKAGKLTGNTDGTVAVSAVINDPDARDRVRMVVRYSSDKSFKTYYTVYSAFGRQGVRHRATMTRLSRNSLYYVRVYTQQRDRKLLSRQYKASSFWTAKSESESVLTGPLVATARERLYLNRFGTGFTQSALLSLRTAGGPDEWLAAQLNPSSIPEASKVAEIDSWFPQLFRTPSDKYASTMNNMGGSSWSYGEDLGNWTMLRRIYSARSLLETMTDFWSSAMHISTGHGSAYVYHSDYDATIRRHALGTFEDLLRECSLHPAMRVYLDNWKSVRNAPNENQGRELLELHTVGATSGYTEAMVKDCAKILSGYTVDWGKTFEASYDSARHTTGPVRVLNFSSVNSSTDGRAVAVELLRYLAHHPATARRVVTKMATFFVSDAPSTGLIDTLADVYTSSGTNISAVLTALAKRPEFLTSEGQKVRTPYGDLVATTRVLGVDVQAPTASDSWARSMNSQHGGPQLFSWPRPDGPPLTSDAWSSPSRLFGSYRMHWSLAGGWWPTKNCTYRKPASWLPSPSLRFDAYVDHLCRLWLGKAADARLLRVAIEAVSGPETWATVTASTTITPDHQVANWQFPRLAIALLDTPDHMIT